MASYFSDFPSKITSSMKVGSRLLVKKNIGYQNWTPCKAAVACSIHFVTESPMTLALIQTALLKSFQHINKTLAQQHLYMSDEDNNC